MKTVFSSEKGTCKKAQKSAQKKYMSPLLVKKRASPAFWARRQVGNCEQEKKQLFAKRKKRGDDV